VCIAGLAAPTSRFVPAYADPLVQEIFGRQSQGLEARNPVSRDLIPLDGHTGIPVEFSLFSPSEGKPVVFYVKAKCRLELIVEGLTVIEENQGLVG
jgi:hypothetical protein